MENKGSPMRSYWGIMKLAMYHKSTSCLMNQTMSPVHNHSKATRYYCTHSTSRIKNSFCIKNRSRNTSLRSGCIPGLLKSGGVNPLLVLIEPFADGVDHFLEKWELRRSRLLVGFSIASHLD